MDAKILKLLGRNDYRPSNVPELLRALGMQPNQQQELQLLLRKLETHGNILRTKGNRYITSREADLASEVAGNIQHIFAVTEQTGEGTKSTAAQVRELSRMAEELRQSVSRFKIS